MQFAICQWTPNVTDEWVRSLAAEGVTALEPGPTFLLDCDEAALEANARLLAEAGIRLYSIHAPFGGEDDLWALKDEPWRKALARHEQSLRRAALAGGECLVIHPGSEGTVEELPARTDRLRASLEALLKVADETGVRMALENMLPRLPGRNSAFVRRMIDEFDSPLLGACLDVGHANVDEGIEAAFAAMGDRTFVFHVQDNDGTNDNHLQPPYGTVDWETFARLFREVGFPHPASIEAPPWRRASWSTQLREVRALLEVGRLTVPLGETRVNVVCRRCGHACFGTPEKWFCACNRPAGAAEGRSC